MKAEEIKSSIVTYAVIIICAVIFMMITASKDKGAAAWKLGAYDRQAIASGQIWRMLTVGFVHIQVWHAAMNLYSLYNMRFMERVLGHAWFAALLFLSVFGGSLFEYLTSNVRFCVGLSGGLYGVIVSYFLIALRLGVLNFRSFMVTLLMNLAINFMPGIAWQAHVGGALSGLVITGIFLWIHSH
ncbi:MAG: rhomboid family intramembrane serine protease [Lachnospiraceae bacterium]|nr:rhomboid family intramembrane serine protease [Lachnospiraceae bacterium]